MHMHTCIFLTKSHFNLSSSPVYANNKIPHQYGTRTNMKNMMEDQDQHNERVWNDIDELKWSMAKLMDMVQAMASIK